jgi:4-alpha-glucanotransferase
MSSKLRREKPQQERINVPSDPKHYWGYRMHINLEDLIDENEFNSELKSMISDSCR